MNHERWTGQVRRERTCKNCGQQYLVDNYDRDYYCSKPTCQARKRAEGTEKES